MKKSERVWHPPNLGTHIAHVCGVALQSERIRALEQEVETLRKAKERADYLENRIRVLYAEGESIALCGDCNRVCPFRNGQQCPSCDEFVCMICARICGTCSVLFCGHCVNTCDNALCDSARCVDHWTYISYTDGGLRHLCFCEKHQADELPEECLRYSCIKPTDA
jgi:hypothetical protein